MSNLIARTLAKARGLDPDEAAEPRQPNAPWYSYRTQAPSPRTFRRIRLYDILRAEKRRIDRSKRQQRSIQMLTEIEAVRRVRAWEAENGESALGHLIDRGDYTIEDVRESKGIPFFDVADKLGLLTEVDE